jgi:phasin family protein
MSLTERLVETTAEVRDQATIYAERAAEAARATADLAASRVAAARAPIDVLTEASLKLNSLSHEHIARLVRRQAAMLKAAVGEGEQRLQRLARAASLPQALAGQAEDLTDIPRRIADNMRQTWAILADAGRDVSQLAGTTLGELAQPVQRVKARKRTAAKGARPAGKTASARRGKRVKATKAA